MDEFIQKMKEKLLREKEEILKQISGSSDDFEKVGPDQRINKIPGMDHLCYKSTFIHTMNQMKRLFPSLYLHLNKWRRLHH